MMMLDRSRSRLGPAPTRRSARISLHALGDRLGHHGLAIDTMTTGLVVLDLLGRHRGRLGTLLGRRGLGGLGQVVIVIVVAAAAAAVGHAPLPLSELVCDGGERGATTVRSTVAGVRMGG